MSDDLGTVQVLARRFPLTTLGFFVLCAPIYVLGEAFEGGRAGWRMFAADFRELRRWVRAPSSASENRAIRGTQEETE